MRRGEAHQLRALRSAVEAWVAADDGTLAERQDARVELHEAWAQLRAWETQA